MKLTLKTRNGGKSASLIRSVPTKVGGKTRRLPTPVGAIRLDDDGDSQALGEGYIKLGKGFDLAEFTPDELDAIHAWFDQAKAAQAAQGGEKVTLASVDSKLSELLSLVQAGGQARPGTGARGAGAHALDDLENAFEEALTDLANQVRDLRAMGVRLTNQKHADPSKPAGATQLDKLQMRANHVRKVLFPRFEDALKTLELMVSKPNAKTEGGAE